MILQPFPESNFKWYQELSTNKNRIRQFHVTIRKDNLHWYAENLCPEQESVYINTEVCLSRKTDYWYIEVFSNCMKCWTGNLSDTQLWSGFFILVWMKIDKFIDELLSLRISEDTVYLSDTINPSSTARSGDTIERPCVML